MAQKSILSICQQLAPAINLPQPQAILTATDTSTQKMYQLLLATCDDLLAEYNWQTLVTRYTFNTVDNQAGYPFPADIERFLSLTFFDQTRRWELMGPLTGAQWEKLQVTNLAATPFQRYRIFGGQIQFYPTPETTTFTFVFEYISNNLFLNTQSQTREIAPLSDADICLLDHRLVIYGTKLKWLESIGHDTTATLVEYNRQLDAIKSQDAPSPVLDARGTTGVGLLSTANVPDGSWA